MAPTTIILTGAPTFSSLNWDESSLSNNVLPYFQCHGSNSSKCVGERNVPPRDSRPIWRSILLNPHQQLHTGLTPLDYGNECEFWAPLDPLEEDDNDNEATQFYNHSFAMHEDVESSQLIASQDISMLSENDNNDSTILISDTSLYLSGREEPRMAGGRHKEWFLPTLPLQLNCLDGIPSAGQLLRLHPQTVTINLVCSVLCPPTSRTMMTGRNTKWKREMQLFEFLVADNTKTGFTCNFWLPTAQDIRAKPSTKRKQINRRGVGHSNGEGGNETKEEDGEEVRIVSSLRPRDIILLRNLALATYRGRVYGQNLRHSTTKLDLLHSTYEPSKAWFSDFDLDPDLGQVRERKSQGKSQSKNQNQDALIERTRMVKDWSIKFIGPLAITKSARATGGVKRQRLHPAGQPGSKRSRDRAVVELPPDTQ